MYTIPARVMVVPAGQRVDARVGSYVEIAQNDRVKVRAQFVPGEGPHWHSTPITTRLRYR